MYNVANTSGTDTLQCHYTDWSGTVIYDSIIVGGPGTNFCAQLGTVVKDSGQWSLSDAGLCSLPPSIYYYNMYLCSNPETIVIGISTNPSITTGTVYNVATYTCYVIIGAVSGPTYNYDLDLCTVVTNCSDSSCLPPP